MMRRQEISDAVSPLGWRLVLGAVCTEVLTSGLADAAAVAASVVEDSGPQAHGHLTLDVRADRIVLRLRSADGVTEHDIALARRITESLAARGAVTTPGGVSVQAIEVAIDAIDIPAVRPFWKAVTGYVDEAGPSDLSGGLVDPAGRGPALWFQQMDVPRPQRNRIHLDVDVPHDEASARIEAALAMGGTLLSDKEAPAFWVLADAEGNEVCVCTWQGRD
ncbi:VOC family protein [Mycolicibacterium sp. CBMA 226]|uniref:VOC family protein n=1 Tax=Mycolicibacterium sp. CBMA 226 TaxID=2606611 RepID=UPI0012DC29F1|nr:VOC family protein [Mycolicibacterium sp. CBMA 226]MUL75220.1 4a-hydroxytetrahydrobiopterin dehydratase [Mycolicibacterium sp. CBMA 226]